MNLALFQFVTLSSLMAACGPTAVSRLADGQGIGAPLFAENFVLPFTIHAPIKEIFDEKENFSIFDVDDGEWEQSYHAASLQLGDMTIPAKIRARGQGSRLGCAFPPFKVKLKASDVSSSLLSGMRAFKTTSHCEDKTDIAARYQREAALYEIVKVIFPKSIKTRLLEMRYIDEKNGIDETHRAAALEDVKDAAERLGLELLELDASIYATPWHAWDNEEASEALLEMFGREILKKEYQRLQQEKPKASKEELSARLHEYMMTQLDQIQIEAEAKTKSKIPSFAQETQALQQDYLQRTDRATAMRLVFFSLMIDNSDWNHFGLNPTATHYAMRNVEIFQANDGTLFPSPYDFDLSGLVRAQVRSTQDFQKELTATWTGLTSLLPAFFSDFDKEAEKTSFLSKRQELSDLIANLPLDESDKKVFAMTITAFFDALENFSFPSAS